MARARWIAVLVTAIAALLLAQYVRAWLAIPDDLARTGDFAGTYAASTLWRTGHAASMYDVASQEQVLATTGTPRDHLYIPFENPPAAAVLASPFSLLDSATAYRAWDVLQLLCVIAALVIVARAAPWPRGSGLQQLSICAVSLAGFGTYLLFVEGQWDGPLVLALAVAYAAWRHDRRVVAGALLGFAAAVAKPHLVIGIAAFMVGRRDWRGLAAAAAGGLAAVIVSVAFAGAASGAAFLHALLQPANSPVLYMQSAVGLTESWFGAGGPAFAAGVVLSIAAAVAAAWLGARSAAKPDALEPLLTAAVALSLFAAPHLLGHDITLLAPMLVVTLAWSADRAETVWPSPMTLALLASWVVLALAVHTDVGNAGQGPPGRVTPIALLLFAGVAAAGGLRSAATHVAHPSAHRVPARILGNDADVAV